VTLHGWPPSVHGRAATVSSLFGGDPCGTFAGQPHTPCIGWGPIGSLVLATSPCDLGARECAGTAETFADDPTVFPNGPESALTPAPTADPSRDIAISFLQLGACFNLQLKARRCKFMLQSIVKRPHPSVASIASAPEVPSAIAPGPQAADKERIHRKTRPIPY
jgi:hypothetical protein